MDEELTKSVTMASGVLMIVSFFFLSINFNIIMPGRVVIDLPLLFNYDGLMEFMIKCTILDVFQRHILNFQILFRNTAFSIIVTQYFF